MALTFSCPHCHKPYRVDDKHAGRKTKCTVCETSMGVPNSVVPPPIIRTTPTGMPQYRHQLPTQPPPIVMDATPFLNQIGRHIDRTLGPAPNVFHEIVSPSVHTGLGCMLVMPPLMAQNSFRLVVNDHVTIHFLALMPIHPGEMGLKLNKGLEALTGPF
jgi:hypothetical protein